MYIENIEEIIRIDRYKNSKISKDIEKKLKQYRKDKLFIEKNKFENWIKELRNNRFYFYARFSTKEKYEKFLLGEETTWKK